MARVHALLTLLRSNRAMRVPALILLALLAACDSPSPAFMHSPATRIEVNGLLFSVRVRGAEAEALRLGPEKIPRLRDVLASGALAIEQVSGCAIANPTKRAPALEGDHAIVRARLDC